MFLGNSTIKNNAETKFLGIYIDSNLKFERHINYLTKKLSSGRYAIRSVAHNLNFAVARNVYFSLVESHLRYGICFWGSASQESLNKIFILQKRAIRNMCKVSATTSCRPLFLQYKILTVYNLYILEMACLIFRKYKNYIPEASVYGTRLTFFLPLPILSSALIQKSIIYNGKKIFNHLSMEIIQIGIEKNFRRQLTTFSVCEGLLHAGGIF